MNCGWRTSRPRTFPERAGPEEGRRPFPNDHTRVICANLSIRLLHAKPYHAWSQGKMERFFVTVQV
jgi:transposase InsO family protein